MPRSLFHGGVPHNAKDRRVQVTESFLSTQRVGVPKGDSRTAEEGLRYEQRVLGLLECQFPGAQLISAPVFRYRAVGDKWRTCIPDAIVVGPSSVLIIEVKRTHHSGAWHQLRGLYQKVVERAYNNSKRVRVLEICKHYDSNVNLPESPIILESIESAHNLLEDDGIPDSYYVGWMNV